MSNHRRNGLLAVTGGFCHPTGVGRGTSRAFEVAAYEGRTIMLVLQRRRDVPEVVEPADLASTDESRG